MEQTKRETPIIECKAKVLAEILTNLALTSGRKGEVQRVVNSTYRLLRTLHSIEHPQANTHTLLLRLPWAKHVVVLCESLISLTLIVWPSGSMGFQNA